MPRPKFTSETAPRRGRPKGAKNKKTVERDLMTWAVEFFNSEEYVTNAQGRILSGKAPHLESYWNPKLKGKPKEETEVKGTLVLRWES